MVHVVATSRSLSYALFDRVAQRKSAVLFSEHDQPGVASRSRLMSWKRVRRWLGPSIAACCFMELRWTLGLSMMRKSGLSHHLEFTDTLCASSTLSQVRYQYFLQHSASQHCRSSLVSASRHRISSPAQKECLQLKVRQCHCCCGNTG